MSIKIGNNDISKIYLGSSEIEKIYQGDTVIYSGGSEPPTPPSYDFVQRLYLTDGTYRDEDSGFNNGVLETVNGIYMPLTTCSALTVGERVTEIGEMDDGLGTWSSLETLTITENVALINDVMFFTYTPTIVFLGTTPPAIDYCYLEVNINVIVPQGCLAAYTAALNENLDGGGSFNITEASPQPQYRWVNIDPNEQVDCVEREPEETEVDTPSNTNQGGGGLIIDDDPVIVIGAGYDAYYLQKKQVSTDGGTTWTDVDPLETQRGELYEENSSACFEVGGSDGNECYTIESNGNPLGDEIWGGDGTFYGYVNDDDGIYYDTNGNPYPQEDYMFVIEDWLQDVYGVDCYNDLGGI